MTPDLGKKIKKHLDIIYDGNYSDNFLNTILTTIQQSKPQKNIPGEKWNEKDIILITYGDSIRDPGKPGLKTLDDFLKCYLKKEISIVHILPFFPYSSDDGFSVIDYYTVNPELGNWDDIQNLAAEFNLMFDLVINHVSSQSQWFKNYLDNKEPGKNYFIEIDKNTDVSKVIRPRSTPLLSKVITKNGGKYVWTTFSEDQIDLDFSNTGLLLEMIKVFLFYLSKGAKVIRLDAIAFLWKEPGTGCLHLSQTHEVVKLLRDIAEYIDPESIILTETNVPNKENLSYFGGGDEANMVYQFSLPPLLLHALHTGNTTYLNRWTSSIFLPGEQRTFLNFTASHDGIGVRPLEGLLPKNEFDDLIENMKKFGGKISTRKNTDGTDIPYEINITYYDALKGTHSGEDDLQAERFICSQTVMMSLAGIPAFYIHSLLATSNYYEGVEDTGRARTINRRKWNKNEIEELLKADPLHKTIFDELSRRIRIRKTISAFHPEAEQKIIEVDTALFIIFRNNKKTEDQLLSVSNFTSGKLNLNLSVVGKKWKEGTDCLSEKDEVLDMGHVMMQPYQTRWIKKAGVNRLL